MGAGGGAPMLTFTCTWAPAGVANSACNSITHSSMLNFVRAIRMICRLKVTPLFSPAYEKSQPLLSSFDGRSSNLLEATHWPLFNGNRPSLCNPLAIVFVPERPGFTLPSGRLEQSTLWADLWRDGTAAACHLEQLPFGSARQVASWCQLVVGLFDKYIEHRTWDIRTFDSVRCTLELPQNVKCRDVPCTISNALVQQPNHALTN